MYKAQKLWYLEQFSLVQALSKADRISVANQIVSKHYKKNDMILFPMNSQKHIHMLKKGVVKIGSYNDKGEEQLKYLLSRGNIFGEMALVDGNADDFAVAAEDCIICSMHIDVLKDFMQRNEGFSISVNKLIGERLRKVEMRLQNIVFKDSRARIIMFLQEFARDFGVQKENGIVVKNLLTNTEIAKLTYTSRQTVSSVMSSLKKNNQIDYNSQYITIFDLQSI